MSVTYLVDEHVAVVTLDDGKANVLTHDALESLHEALDRAEAARGDMPLSYMRISSADMGR